jgi:hypothetical protein
VAKLFFAGGEVLCLGIAMRGPCPPWGSRNSSTLGTIIANAGPEIKFRLTISNDPEADSFNNNHACDNYHHAFAQFIEM